MWALLLTACSTPAPTPPPPPAEEAGERPSTEAPPAPPPLDKLPIVKPNNRPPKITGATITPDKPDFRTALKVEVTTIDPDDTPTDIDCVWYVNDEEVLGFIDDTLPAGKAGPGDRVRVHVVANDGELSDEVDVGAVRIENLPPRMVTEPRQLTRFDGFQLKAEDPEGEPLTWSVSGGPEGLTVSELGTLRYPGSDTEPGGAYTVTIKATDPHGGWARIDVPITVSPGSKARKAE